MSSVAASSHVRAARVPTLAVGLAAIAVGLAAVALLGPLVTGVVDYRVTGTLRNQTIGLDAVSFVVVAPLALLAAVLVARGRVAGQSLALGIGPYTSYMFLQYVLGPDYAHLPGNNERLFALALALFVGGWVTTLAAWRALPAQQPRRHDRRLALVLAVLGALTFSRYLPALLDWTSATPTDDVYLAGPGFAWAIALLDLGVLLPLVAAACVGLRRGAAWGRALTLAVSGWLGLVGLAVAGMAITMQLNGDPNASAPGAVFMTVLGLAFAAFAVVVHRPLFRR